MPMSKPNVPKFDCCIHVSVPNTKMYSAIRTASARAEAVSGDAQRARGSNSPDGGTSGSGGVGAPLRGRVRGRRNDCANERERVSTAGVYGQDQGQWTRVTGRLTSQPVRSPEARRAEPSRAPL